MCFFRISSMCLVLHFGPPGFGGVSSGAGCPTVLNSCLFSSTYLPVWFCTVSLLQGSCFHVAAGKAMLPLPVEAVNFSSHASTFSQTPGRGNIPKADAFWGWPKVLEAHATPPGNHSEQCAFCFSPKHFSVGLLDSFFRCVRLFAIGGVRFSSRVSLHLFPFMLIWLQSISIFIP